MQSARRKKLRRILLALAGCVLLGALAGVLASFRGVDAQPENSVSSGTVKLTDDDGGGALYSVAADGVLAPGDSIERCIRVTYEGNLAASVAFYRDPAESIANGTKFTIKVERGTQSTPSFPSCTGFTPVTTAFAEADLDAFPTTYAGGPAGKDGGAAWAQGDSVTYRFTLKAKSGATPDGGAATASTGNHSFKWEARNN